MSNIIDFSAAKLAKGPHRSGEAVCLCCEHEFVAVAPVGARWLQCPVCHTHLATFAGPCCPPEDALVFHCACGNDLFTILVDGLLCPVCGFMHEK